MPLSPEEIEEFSKVYQEELAARRGESKLMGPETEEASASGARTAVTAVTGALGGRYGAPLVGAIGRGARYGAGVLGSALGGGAGAYVMSPPEERNSQAAREAILSAAGEGLSPAVGGALRLAGKPIGAVARPAMERLQALMSPLTTGASARVARLSEEKLAEGLAAHQTLQREGLGLTSEQMAEYLPPGRRRNLHQMAGGILSSTSSFKTLREKSEASATASVADFVDRLSLIDPKAAAQLQKEALSNSTAAHRIATRASWMNLDNLLKSVGDSEGVDIQKFWDAGGKELTRASIPLRPGLASLARKVQQLGRRAESQEFGYPTTSQPGSLAPITPATPGRTVSERVPFLSFEEAQDVKGALNEMANFPDQYPGVDGGFVRKLIRILDQEMDAAGSRLTARGNPEVVAAYQEAKELSRTGYTLLNNQLTRKWLTSLEPERVFESIFDKQSPSRISMLRRIYERGAEEGVVPLGAWDEVANQWYRHVFDASAGAAKRGPVNAEVALEEIAQFRKWGGLDELFNDATGRAQVKSFENLFKVVAATQAKSPTGGQLALNIIRLGAVPTLAYSVYTGEGLDSPQAAAAALFLAGPSATARIMRDPELVELMTKSFSGRAQALGNRAVGQLLVRLHQIAKDEKIEDLQVNEGIRAQVDEATGELVPSLSDISIQNRPDRPGVTLTPDQRAGLLQGQAPR